MFAEINDATSAKNICGDYIANAQGVFSREKLFSHLSRIADGILLRHGWERTMEQRECSSIRGSVSEKDWHSMLVKCLSLIIIIARRGNKRSLMNRIAALRVFYVR